MDSYKLYKEIADSLPVAGLFRCFNQPIDFDTVEPLDNLGSMEEFLNNWEIPQCCIYIHDGTQVILQHPSFNYKLKLDSNGRGDFYSHRIEISKYIE